MTSTAKVCVCSWKHRRIFASSPKPSGLRGHPDGRYLSPSLTENPLDAYLSRAPGALSDPYDSLTAREREVLHWAAGGLTNPEIASTLFSSLRTVETHRPNLMRKLSLRSQTDLIRYALRRGILPMES